MSQALDPTIRDLNNCDCCDGLSARTPVDIVNRPGLAAVAYRAGTHAAFKHSMLAALSDGRRAALAAFNTRDDDDFTIALLDAWAMTADVLTFYQERIANESYLRTATERRSVLELARTIGYELAPGVAASTWLAFTVEEANGAPRSATGIPPKVIIPAGTHAQSVPGQEELPQDFETTEAIEARGEWNALKPRSVRPELPAAGRNVLYLKGTETGLAVGDMILLVAGERLTDPGNRNWDVGKVAGIVTVSGNDAVDDHTVIMLDRPLGAETLFTGPEGKGVRAYALRQRAALFGSNAPEWRPMPKELKAGYLGVASLTEPIAPKLNEEWPRFTIADISGTMGQIHLDALYPKIVTGSWIVLADAEEKEVYRVADVAESSRTKFTLNSRTTLLTLEGINLLAKFNNRLRETMVHAVSEELAIAGEPITMEVAGDLIELEGRIDGLKKGGYLALTGVDTATGIPLSEVATIGEVIQGDDYTTVKFGRSLSGRFRRAGLSINANVAAATHGETKSEVLGSGDASKVFQRFTLSQKPLTYVSADNAAGGASTLRVRVNDVLWEEVPTLHGRGPREHVYITRADDEGNVTVIFGDGKSGARLPSGSENVTALYRVGIGKEGEVDADQISLLISPPLAVEGVINPVAASGAADPQTPGDTRANAPRRVLTLGRIVSLRDFEDFAAAFAGIGKAMATWTWNRNRRGVLITVAGAGGAAVREGEKLHTSLLAAIARVGDPHIPVQVKSYRPVTFTIHGRVAVDPLHRAEKVAAEIEQALRSRFSFNARAFGESVHLSDVIAVIQRVRGVLFVDIDEIRRTTGGDNRTPLAAFVPRPGSVATADAAELLTLDPGPLNELEVM